MDSLLPTLCAQFPQVTFQASDSFYWSPRKQLVHYSEKALEDVMGLWSLLHEVGHATLGHQSFSSDFELLEFEVAAWAKARILAQTYGLSISEDHIQDCLDTYRDWLYQRSTCPTCTSCGLQSDAKTYHCLNCDCTWQVSASRLCRPYRRTRSSSSK